MTAVMALCILASKHTDPHIAASVSPLLVQLLDVPSPNLQWKALIALGHLSGNPENIAQAVAAGAVPLLVGLLTTPGASTEKLRRSAAEALGHLAVRAQSEIIAAGAIEPLVDMLLKSTSEDTQLAATLALVNLSSRNEAGRPGIVSAGAIAPLVRVLKATRSEELQARASSAINNLASHDAKAIVRAGAIPILVQRLDQSAGAGGLRLADHCR